MLSSFVKDNQNSMKSSTKLNHKNYGYLRTLKSKEKSLGVLIYFKFKVSKCSRNIYRSYINKILKEVNFRPTLQGFLSSRL